jgi:hypothetical protein
VNQRRKAEMKFSRRVIVSILFIMLILLFGMVFWSFILNDIIRPTSLVIWLFLRIFVLSIDQKYYWGAIVFIVVIFLFRLLPQAQIAVQSEDFLNSNATIKNIGYWRSLFTQTGYDAQDQVSLKRELIHLLLSLYASKQRTSTNYILYDALQKGELPLPEHIHKYLFPDEPNNSQWSVNNLVQSVRTTPRKWIRRWTGQETAEHYQMINEVLSFMETSMEMRNDNGKFTQNKH